MEKISFIFDEYNEKREIVDKQGRSNLVELEDRMKISEKSSGNPIVFESSESQLIDVKLEGGFNTIHPIYVESGIYDTTDGTKKGNSYVLRSIEKFDVNSGDVVDITHSETSKTIYIYAFYYNGDNFMYESDESVHTDEFIIPQEANKIAFEFMLDDGSPITKEDLGDINILINNQPYGYSINIKEMDSFGNDNEVAIPIPSEFGENDYIEYNIDGSGLMSLNGVIKPLTEEQIIAFKQLKSYKGQTTITVSGEGTITATYYKNNVNANDVAKIQKQVVINKDEIDNVYNEVNNIEDKIIKQMEDGYLQKNIIDKVINGYELGTDGTLTQNVNWYVTDFINVRPNTYYTSSGLSSSFVVYYDEDKEFVGNDRNHTFKTPNDAVYVRLNSHIDGYSTPQLEEGTTPTKYTPYCPSNKEIINKVPNTRKVNNKSLSNDIVLTSSDIAYNDSNIKDKLDSITEGLETKASSTSVDDLTTTVDGLSDSVDTLNSNIDTLNTSLTELIGFELDGINADREINTDGSNKTSYGKSVAYVKVQSGVEYTLRSTKNFIDGMVVAIDNNYAVVKTIPASASVFNEITFTMPSGATMFKCCYVTTDDSIHNATLTLNVHKEFSSLNSNLTDLKNEVDGNNLIYGTWKNGYTVTSSGNYNDSTTYHTNNNQYKCTEGEYISVKVDSLEWFGVCFYDENGNYLHKYIESNTVLSKGDYVPQNASYFTVYKAKTQNIVVTKIAKPFAQLNESLTDQGLLNVFDGKWTQGYWGSSGYVSSNSAISTETKHTCKPQDKINVTYGESVYSLWITFFKIDGSRISTTELLNTNSISAVAPNDTATFIVAAQKYVSGNYWIQEAKHLIIHINNAIDGLKADLGVIRNISVTTGIPANGTYDIDISSIKSDASQYLISVVGHNGSVWQYLGILSLAPQNPVVIPLHSSVVSASYANNKITIKNESTQYGMNSNSRISIVKIC